MTFTDIIVLLLSAGGVCWFHARQQKSKPHRYADKLGAAADDAQE